MSNDPTPIIIDEYDVNLGYHRSVIPLDIRLGITSSPSAASRNATEQQPLRWGILATGKVAHDFVQVLKFLPHHTITAVGSRTIDRAELFARRHGIPTAHGTYEELCQDSNVDIVYIASLHPNHKEHAAMALNSGKHTLVEKPMTMKAEDAQFVYDLGKKKQLFVGEGMWTRFFPAVEWTRSHLGVAGGLCNNNDDGGCVLEELKIGNVRVIQADFSIDGNDVGPYPEDSLYSKPLGGGSAWTMLPYVVGAALLPFGRDPDRIAANGIIPADYDGDVGDVAIGMTMTFTIDEQQSDGSRENSPPGNKAIASGVVGYLAESSEVTMYAGKSGRITVNSPAHCPTSATLIRKSIGSRGNGATSDSGGDSSPPLTAIKVEFPLPLPTKEIEDSGGIQLPNSLGFIYEAEAVRRLISAKHYTFPQWTPEESVACIRSIEKMLNQINS
jgi:dihydrodiol dehydrogenase / D-xylose 1-dehydrogenase (NADP)